MEKILFGGIKVIELVDWKCKKCKNNFAWFFPDLMTKKEQKKLSGSAEDTILRKPSKEYKQHEWDKAELYWEQDVMCWIPAKEAEDMNECVTCHKKLVELKIKK